MVDISPEKPNKTRKESAWNYHQIFDVFQTNSSPSQKTDSPNKQFAAGNPEKNSSFFSQHQNPKSSDSFQNYSTDFCAADDNNTNIHNGTSQEQTVYVPIKSPSPHKKRKKSIFDHILSGINHNIHKSYQQDFDLNPSRSEETYFEGLNNLTHDPLNETTTERYWNSKFYHPTRRKNRKRNKLYFNDILSANSEQIQKTMNTTLSSNPTSLSLGGNHGPTPAGGSTKSTVTNASANRYQPRAKQHSGKTVGAKNREFVEGLMPEPKLELTFKEKQYLIAVEKGDIPTVSRILEEAQLYFHININCVDPLNRSALLIAIENDNLEMIEVLLKYHVDTRDAILYAISEEMVEAVELLHNYEDEQSAKAFEEEKRARAATAVKDSIAGSTTSPSISAAREAMEAMSGGKGPAGPTIAGTSTMREYESAFTSDITPLILAAHKDNYEIVKMLLDRGSKISRPHDVRCGCRICVQQSEADSLRHSLSRIHAYRALSSPSLICLTSRDPIMTAFTLSWELTQLSRMEYEFTGEYEELAQKCKQFATDLLDQTRTSFELKVILNHVETERFIDMYYNASSATKLSSAFNNIFASTAEEDSSLAWFTSAPQRLVKATWNGIRHMPQTLGSLCHRFRPGSKERHKYKDIKNEITGSDSSKLGKIPGSDTTAPTDPATIVAKERMHLSRLKSAIKYDQKEFVSHPNCQQLLGAIWSEGLPGYRRRNLLSRMLIVLSIAVLFPILSICYIVAPHRMPGRVMKKPFIKFICNSASYITFLILLILASQRIENLTMIVQGEQQHVKNERRGSLPTTFEWMILAWIAGLVWTEIKQLWVEGLQEYLEDMWNVLDFITNALYIATITLRIIAYLQVQKEIAENNEAAFAPRKDWVANDPTLISEGLFAAANIFSSLKLVYIFTVNPYLGPLQITLGRMTFDILRFSIIVILVVFSFACGLTQLYWYYGEMRAEECNRDKSSDSCNKKYQRFSNLFETVQTLYWAFYGLVELENTELKEPHVYTEFIGLLMFGVYSAIAIVVLLNMLIAMMSNSYQIISDSADLEWKFARSKLWISYFDEGATVPPPFNIIPSPKSIYYTSVWLLDCIYGCLSLKLKRTKWRSLRKMFQKANEKESRYQMVIRSLVKRYITNMQRKRQQFAGVTEDDINEIKQDISSFRFEMLEIFKRTLEALKGTHELSDIKEDSILNVQMSGMKPTKKILQKERRLLKGSLEVNAPQSHSIMVDKYGSPTAKKTTVYPPLTESNGNGTASENGNGTKASNKPQTISGITSTSTTTSSTQHMHKLGSVRRKSQKRKTNYRTWDKLITALKMQKSSSETPTVSTPLSTSEPVTEGSKTIPSTSHGGSKKIAPLTISSTISQTVTAKPSPTTTTLVGILKTSTPSFSSVSASKAAGGLTTSVTQTTFVLPSTSTSLEDETELEQPLDLYSTTEGFQSADRKIAISTTTKPLLVKDFSIEEPLEEPALALTTSGIITTLVNQVSTSADYTPRPKLGWMLPPLIPQTLLQQSSTPITTSPVGQSTIVTTAATTGPTNPFLTEQQPTQSADFVKISPEVSSPTTQGADKTSTSTDKKDTPTNISSKMFQTTDFLDI